MLDRLIVWLRGLSRGTSPDQQVRESVVRTAPTYSIGAIWVDLLGQNGIPARCASDLSSSFMGDAVGHRVIVRRDQAKEAAEVLDALWPDDGPEHEAQD